MKTAKVRIAVSVDNTGNWSSGGYKDAPDNISLELSQEDLLGDSVQVFWIEVNLPVPEVNIVDSNNIKVEGG